MATRDLTTDVKDEIVKALIRPALFYEGEFDGLTLRLWTGLGEMSWDSKTWLGNGWLQGISPASEALGAARRRGLTVLLNGVDPSALSAALGSSRQGLNGRIWLAFLTEALAVIADPYLLFTGKLDTPEINQGAESTGLALTYEDRHIALDKAPGWRWTSEDQKTFFPEDQGFDYISGLQARDLTWGVASGG